MRFNKFFFGIICIIWLSTNLSYAEKPELSRDSTQARVFKSKSPMGALLRSVAFPGWGQFYNRKYLKTGLAFGTETTFLVLMAIEWKRMDDHRKLFNSLPEDHADKLWENEQYKFYRDRKNLYLWSTIATIFISMFDAFVDAHLDDFDKEMERIGFEIYPDSDVKINLKVSFDL